MKRAQLTAGEERATQGHGAPVASDHGCGRYEGFDYVGLVVVSLQSTDETTSTCNGENKRSVEIILITIQVVRKTLSSAVSRGRHRGVFEGCPARANAIHVERVSQSMVQQLPWRHERSLGSIDRHALSVRRFRPGSNWVPDLSRLVPRWGQSRVPARISKS